MWSKASVSSGGYVNTPGTDAQPDAPALTYSSMAKRTYAEILAWSRTLSKEENANRLRSSRARDADLRMASRPKQCKSCQQRLVPRAHLVVNVWAWTCRACGDSGLAPAAGARWDSRRNAASRKALAAMGYVPKKRGK